MTSPWIAAAFALFAWWFSTGAILFAVRVADRANRGTALTVLSLPVFALGVWGLSTTFHIETPMAATYAFLSALAVWGWIELAFLTGEITGPNTSPCPEGVPEWERFLRAWGTVAYHEILLTAALIAILWFGWGAPNAFGLWTFVVLYFARVSAKLNLYAGVPRINVEFLPAKLTHLQSHFRIAPMNWLYPVSITALTFATACWLERLYAVSAPADVTGFALLAAITTLALLEHWLMVLPLPDAKLWRWMLPAPKRQDTTREMADGL
ncbi:putative photosynthetic complex assembly protein PuhE [Pseudaestuariivita atlantica]|uniref:putative photosynthetic complex assembly protein PuhE n=1 Tax=Pseudaestuariivita atlantica TaxID=1317121 RepID=UPI001F5F4B80|nr:putative photosynthetic complex assembly protein PuhE [Pseudaestuariivita atlantica]